MAIPLVKKTKHHFVTAATLVAAAKTMADRGEGDLGEILRARALSHYGDALFQHLTLRHGSVEEARKTIDALRQRISEIDAQSLIRPPGVRARLFRMARDLAGRQRHGAHDALPWAYDTSSNSHVSRAVVQVRRGGLGTDEELLELRFARELTPPEIAFVIGMDEEQVSAHLDRAVSHARELFALGKEGVSRLPGALMNAFSIEAREDEALEKTLDVGYTIGGRYRVEAHVGSGGFADVYRATDLEVAGHVVALKLLHRRARTQDEREQALRELHLIASVFHPSIVQFKDHGWHDQRFWFVMPWYEGESLDARINRGALSRLEAREIFVPVARALATMHGAGMRHQDVKPDNIYLARLKGYGEKEGEGVLPVLLDLGVAAKEAELLLAGTPDYFAPEVASQFAQRVAGKVTPAADVFSLALALRNALEPETAEEAPGDEVDDFIQKRAETPPKPPKRRELRYLRPYFKRWMHVDPDKRPTADELADELRVLTLPEDRHKRRMRVLRTVLPLMLAATAVFLGVAWQLDQRARKESDRAEQARIEAEGVKADLEIEEARRKELEDAAEAAEERYRSSRLTREELAGRLAENETQLAFTREAFGRARIRNASLTDNVRQARRRIDELEGTVTEGKRQIGELNERVQSLRTELDASKSKITQAQSDLNTAKQQLSKAEERASSLEADARRSDAELRAANEKLAAAESSLEAAKNEKQRLEKELAAAKEAVASNAASASTTEAAAEATTDAKASSRRSTRKRRRSRR